MNEPALTISFDFREVIASALTDYLPRPAIQDEILSYLGENRTGCCVIIGEPGSGKTSLAAKLIRDHGYLHHFLRRGHTEFSLWRDPYAFLTSLGFQLKERFGDEIFPEQVAIDVQGHVRDLEETGSYVGTEIQQLVAVPWHSITLNVSLKAVKIRGEATGVRIRHVVEDYRSIPLSTFREMALVDPLRRLSQLHPDERLVLWVDGLDEVAELGPDSSPTGQDITTILPLPAELAELGNLLLVISSRPNPLLDRFMDGGASLIDLGDARFEHDNAALVERYIDRELTKDSVKERIAEAGKQPAEIRQEVIKACEHNLLYLRHFFIALKKGELVQLLAGGLPEGLHSIYARLLERVVRSAGGRYLPDYHPVVSVLAVAARGLSTEQMMWFCGLDRNRVNAVVAELRQFLDVERIKQSNTYRFYHRSFGENLVSSDYRDEVWYVDPETAHGRVAQFYLGRWEVGQEPLDDYGFEFLTYHLARSGGPLQRSLFTLLGKPWRLAKRKHYRSNLSFSADLAAAAECARVLPFPDALIETATLALMDTLLADANRKLPGEALEMMVRLGQIQRAFDYIQPDVDSFELIQRLADMARGFTAGADSSMRFLYQVLQQGLEVCAANPDQSHGLLAVLLEACQPDDDARMDELLRRATQIFSAGRSYWETPRALMELARLLTAVDPRTADEIFRQAFETIPQYAGNSSNENLLLFDLLRYWSDFDSNAVAALPLSIAPNADGVKAMVIFSRAAASSENQAALPNTYTALREQLLPQITDPFELARALTALASLDLEMGEQSRAVETVDEALAAIKQIGGADDPERDLQNRLSQATTVLITVAEMDVQLDPNRGQATLRQAWSSLREHGWWAWGITLNNLVRTQFHINRDLLEAEIENMPEIEVRSDLLVAAARETLNSGDALAAAELLEAALTLREDPLPRDSARAELYLRVAETLDLSDRDAAKSLLDQTILDDAEVVSWRLDVLRRLAECSDPAGPEWLEETILLWDQPDFNTNFVCELPGIVKDLPASWVQQLARSVKRLVSPTQKRLMSAAVSAILEGSDPTAETLRQVALDGLSAEDPELLIPAYRVLAFTAGQWWDVERRLAEGLLIDALLSLETDGHDGTYGRSRRYPLMSIIEDLLLGAPEAALPLLLAWNEPPPAPNELYLRVPSSVTPPHRAAGIEDRDYLLAVTLAREAYRHGTARDQLATLANPVVRGLAASTGARLNEDAPLDLRLAWCEVAQRAAKQVEGHYLQCLFSGDAAEAFLAIGAKRKAIELARATAQEIIDQGRYYESIFRQPAYTHALGKCIQIIAVVGDDHGGSDAVALLWEARRLGIGLHTVLGYLVSIVSKANGSPLQSLLDAEERGLNLYS
jgi:hypothetical protein